MPLTQLVCPHCESTIEVPVTSVTRTRQCPSCGRSIVLQFATRVTAAKRRALLVLAKEIGVSSVEEVPEVSMALAGNPRNRLWHDPKVKSNASFLVWGLLGIFLALGLLLTGYFLDWWPWLNGNGGNHGVFIPISMYDRMG